MSLYGPNVKSDLREMRCRGKEGKKEVPDGPGHLRPRLGGEKGSLVQALWAMMAVFQV